MKYCSNSRPIAANFYAYCSKMAHANNWTQVQVNVAVQLLFTANAG